MSSDLPTCWVGDKKDSSIICPNCGPTHVRSVWDEGMGLRVECTGCGAKATIYLGPGILIDFDKVKRVLNLSRP